MPRGGGLDAGEAVRHLLALRADDDGHVGDGLAGPGRALLLVLVLQRPRGVRQAGHHEVIHQLRGLLVRHGSRHLRAGGTARTRTPALPEGPGGAVGSPPPAPRTSLGELTGRKRRGREGRRLPVCRSRCAARGRGSWHRRRGWGRAPTPSTAGCSAHGDGGPGGPWRSPPEAGSWSPRPHARPGCLVRRAA